MSTNSKSYFSNAVPGEHQVFEGNIYRLDSTPVMAVGSRIARADGNVYRYAKFEDSGYSPGRFVGPDQSTTFHADSDNGLLGTTVTNPTSGQIGSYVVEAAGASWTKDIYAGGYLIVTDDAGEAYTYRIKGNTAGSTGATSGYSKITLCDPLQVALTAASDVSIIGSMYNELRYATLLTDPIASGVSITTTTSTYLWSFVQTWGVCGLYFGTAVTGSAGLGADVGQPIGLCMGSVTGSYGFASTWPPLAAGIGNSVEGSDFFNSPIYGYILDIGDATGLSPCYITIAP